MIELWRLVRGIFYGILIVVYLVFEVLIWEEVVKPVINALKELKIYEKFLDYIRSKAPKEMVLVLFILPFVLGEGLGIFSGILAAKLYFFSALIIYACKIPLVIFAFAILENGKEKLLSYRWFALSYTWSVAQLEKLHNYPLYIQITGMVKKGVKAFKKFWK